ncbi:MAG: 50S ribosomal protein L29 [Ferruginibacter sp.]|nr:50S ribosomal protein L29 [Cytophagales bacterium]
MKNDEIRTLSVEALRQQIVNEQQTLQRLKFAHAVTPIENPMRIRATRKLIARLHTELTVKEKPTTK